MARFAVRPTVWRHAVPGAKGHKLWGGVGGRDRFASIAPARTLFPLIFPWNSRCNLPGRHCCLRIGTSGEPENWALPKLRSSEDFFYTPFHVGRLDNDFGSVSRAWSTTLMDSAGATEPHHQD